MEVTLRKAAAFSKALLAAADKLTPANTLSVSIYLESDLGDEVEKARKGEVAKIDLAETLIASAFTLRTEIGRINNAIGISALLAEKAALERAERTYAAFYDRQSRSGSDVSVAKRQLAALAERAKNATSYSPSGERLDIGLVDEATAADGEQRRIVNKRRLSDIADALITLNMTQKVDLSDKMVELLKGQNII